MRPSKFGSFQPPQGITMLAGIIGMALIAVTLGYFLGNLAIDWLTTTSGLPYDDGVFSTTEIGTRDTDQIPGTSDTTTPTEGITWDNIISEQDLTDGAKDIEISLYKVQVGKFQSREDAQALQVELNALGYETFVTTEYPYTIQLGAFTERVGAEEIFIKAQEDGYDVSMVLEVE